MNKNFQTEFRRVLPCLISRGRITKKQTGASLSLYSVMEMRARGGYPCSVRPPWPRLGTNENDKYEENEEP